MNIALEIRNFIVWNYKKVFMSNSETLAFHCGSNHLKSLAGSNSVSEKCVSTEYNSCNCAFLIFAQLNFRIYTFKRQIFSNFIEVSTSPACEQGVEFIFKSFASFRSSENPSVELFSQHCLALSLLLCSLEVYFSVNSDSKLLLVHCGYKQLHRV